MAYLLRTMKYPRKINKMLVEKISAEEAYSEFGSLKTIIDGKRDIGFLTLGNPLYNLMIKMSGLKKIKVESSDGVNYIVYRDRAEKEALELFDIAKKYDGKLDYRASDEDSKRIGQILGYEDKEIEDYIIHNKKIRGMTEAKKNNLRLIIKKVLKEEEDKRSDFIEKLKIKQENLGLDKIRKLLRDLLKNSDKTFSDEKSSSNDSDSKNEIDSTQFIDKLKKLEDSTKKFENQKSKGSPIPYDDEVEIIQSALQILGFSLPRWGVDGKFGNETERAVLNFQKEYNLDETGILDENQLLKLVKSSIEAINKDDSLLSKIQTTKTETLPDDKVGKKQKNEVTSTSDNEYAIIKPKNYDGKNVHVLFGGSHTSGYGPNSAKPQNIQKYVSVLSPYANDVIIVVTHHMNSLDNVRKYVKEEFGGEVTSIAGFSQGGRETWNHAGDSSLNLVGLIDPSTYETGIRFGSNTYLYCDPKNWGTSGFYGQTRRRLEWYCSNKEKYGSQVECFNQGGTHMNFQILKSFYNKFGNRL